jgi:predicted dehydrogenase
MNAKDASNPKTTERLDRRQFLTGAATAAAATAFTIVPSHVLGGPARKAPSDKLNIAGVGLNGMGAGDVANCKSENIVALCDVDGHVLGREARKYPGAKLHTDFRKMLETQKDIDAVICATPDHNHAVVSIMAMKLGKHVHCQKPLTHSVWEARQMAKVAKEAGVVTQMGNQGQASEGARVICEYIQSGAIGTVREVHGWSNRNPMISPRGIARPRDTQPVPKHINWDLWVGPAPMRPYHPCYHPFAWRGWWDFGTGCLGDIGCHQFSAVFKALKLHGVHPTVIEASSSNHQMSKEVRRETAPVASITRWYFPAKGDRAAFKLVWWDGGLTPPRPEELEPNRSFGHNDGLYVIGDKAKILGHRPIPETKAKEIGRPPRTLGRSPGHYQEWIQACKGGKPAGSDFVLHAAHLAEVVLLGNIALRTEQRLQWDGENFKFTNSDEANAYLNPPYREGWSL